MKQILALSLSCQKDWDGFSGFILIFNEALDLLKANYGL